MIKKLGLYSNKLHFEYLQYFLNFIKKAELHNFQVFLHKNLQNFLINNLENDYEFFDENNKSIDLLITIGGDGTFLNGVHKVSNYEIPVLGINIGKLGFLSAIEVQEIDAIFSNIISNNFIIEERSLIEIDSKCNLRIYNYAINEFTVYRYNLSMIRIEVYINELYFNTYLADGIIISTPTGSTAYSLSCGGPIIYPTLNAFVITPVACHNLSIRPFVLPDNSIIKVKVDDSSNKYIISSDNTYQLIESNIEFVIKKSKKTFKVMYFKNYNFYQTLRNKLNWGIDKRI